MHAEQSPEDRPAAQQRERDDRSVYERFVQAVHDRVSRPTMFFVAAAVIVAWLVSVPVWEDLKAWQVAIHTVASVVTLVMLFLLENAGRRGEEAAQEKLNVLAEALAALLDSRAADDPDLRTAARTLREAVGLEERH